MPRHAEKALQQHINKNLPGHLKQYSQAYMHQQVMYPTGGGGPATAPAMPARSGVRATNMPRGPRGAQTFGRADTAAGGPATNPIPQTPDSDPNDPYGFIMNPQKPPRTPFLTTGSLKKRILIIAAIFMILIIISLVISSLLSSSGNAQRDKLLALAQTQSEIVRLSDAASDRLTDRDLINKSANVRLSAESSKQQVVSALAKRGFKVKDKELASSQASANDAALTEGQQNSRFDQTYNQLLEKQLASYQAQLEDVYSSGSSSEKELTLSANEQINLLLGKKINQ